MKRQTTKQLILACACLLVLGGCKAKAENGSEAGGGTINVITREEGSGTRGAFTELSGVLVKEGDSEVDHTLSSATIQNGTSGVMTTVAGDKAAIGYLSVGSLNETVKALKIDGAAPETEQIKSGEYPLARPFNVAFKGELEAAAEDFWGFVFSREGQDVVIGEGYIEAEDNAPAYESKPGLKGQISVVGSTSVTPIMEALAEAYKEVQPGITIDITSNGSSAGMTAAMDGSADIGMASRELKEEEEKVLEHKPLAIDGIAVVVNPDNPIEELSLNQIRDIFTGEKTKWEDYVQK